MIILHTGTNDLERSNSPEELISNILILITEASTKFPSSKIFFSTLLPRNDIPTPIITSINVQLINSCSRLPNVQLIKHDNLFANQLNILHDNKYILKRHIGLFAKNLKDAIHGRIRPRTATSFKCPANPKSTTKSTGITPRSQYSVAACLIQQCCQEHTALALPPSNATSAHTTCHTTTTATDTSSTTPNCPASNAPTCCETATATDNPRPTPKYTICVSQRTASNACAC